MADGALRARGHPSPGNSSPNKQDGCRINARIALTCSGGAVGNARASTGDVMSPTSRATDHHGRA